MRIIHIIFSLFITIPCVAQDYKPLLDNYNEWQLTNCYSGCITDMYYTDGDTLVGGKNYKILDGYHFISRTFLLREELDSRKVYLNLVQQNREYLLYDFSLNIGDSINIKNPISPFPMDAGYFKIDSIFNRPLFDGNDYKHFYLSPTPSNTISSSPAIWIEGVGSLSLINAPGGFPDLNGVGLLTCFFKNGQLFYTIVDDCEPLVLTKNDNNTLLNEVSFNSLIKNGHFQMKNSQNIQHLAVFDLNGRKLMEIKPNNQEEIHLDFSNISNGMYLIVAQFSTFEKKVFKVLVK